MERKDGTDTFDVCSICLIIFLVVVGVQKPLSRRDSGEREQPPAVCCADFCLVVRASKPQEGQISCLEETLLFPSPYGW